MVLFTMCYEQHDTGVEENALDQSRGDEGCVLKAAFGGGDGVAGVRDKPFGSIVECRAGAKERRRAPEAEEFWLILESALEKVDGIPERLGVGPATLPDHLHVAAIRRNVGNSGAVVGNREDRHRPA